MITVAFPAERCLDFPQCVVGSGHQHRADEVELRITEDTDRPADGIRFQLAALISAVHSGFAQ